MTLLALLRHAETDWSRERRIQGRTDVPLSTAERSRLRASVLPTEVSAMRVLTSPLSRCTETAALLGLADARTDSRLIEMHWGSWEGRTLAEIRRELGEVMQSNEARGWDFTPDGGESPRQVFNRVKHLLCDIASDGQPTLAIAHKGIIRVLYAAAADWNLLGRPPIKFDWKALHLFELNSDGQPRVLRMNIPLANRLVEAGN